METRKLIQSGQSALIITLPKKWTEHNNLKKGDTIKLDILSNKLIVSLLGSELETSNFTVIPQNESDASLELLIYSAFFSDKKRITIKEVKKDDISKVLSIIKKIPYLKIEDKGKDYITLIFIVDSNIIDIKSEIKRTFFILENFFDSITKTDSNTEELQEIYNQLVMQVILMLKMLKLKFLEYDKNSILMYKQQIDSYYFLVKTCKEFLLFTKRKDTTNQHTKLLIEDVINNFRKMLNAIEENNLKKILIFQESIQKERYKIIDDIVSKKERLKLEIGFLLNDLYKVIENIGYSYINNR